MLLLLLLPLTQASTLKAAGVDKVVCVTVGEPGEVQQWAAKNGFDKTALVSREGLWAPWFAEGSGWGQRCVRVRPCLGQHTACTKQHWRQEC